MQNLKSNDKKTEMDPIFREFHDDEALLNDLKHAVIILRNGYNHMNLALQSILETNACSAVSFSKATVTIKTIEDAGRRGSFVAGSIFCDGIYVLEQYIDAKKVPKEYLRRNVLAKLLKFLSKEGRLWLRGAGQLGPKPKTNSAQDANSSHANSANSSHILEGLSFNYKNRPFPLAYAQARLIIFCLSVG